MQPEKGSVVQAFFKYFVATELHVGTLLVHAHTHTRTHRHVFTMHTCTHTCTQTDSSSEWVDPLGGGGQQVHETVATEIAILLYISRD